MTEGRWPANVLLSHAPLLDEYGWPIGDACAEGCVPGCAVAELDEQSGTLTTGGGDRRAPKAAGTYGAFAGNESTARVFDANTGGASRFFPTFRYSPDPQAGRAETMTDDAAPPTVTLYPGDCLAVLATLPDESVHCVITDPPYGLSDLKPAAVITAMTAWANGDRDHVPDAKGFMGRDWDAFVPPPAVWDECLRVLKPGGHLAAFSAPRTQDLMGLSIRMAGFEIRDGLQWLQGAGFPKSLDVGKALSKQADPGFVSEVKAWLAARFDDSGKTKTEINRECGFTASDYLITEYGADAGGRRTSHLLLPYGEKWARLREVVGFPDTYDARIEEYARIIGKVPVGKAESAGVFGDFAGEVTSYASTDAARAWQGWGTALKPSVEPIILARKPFDRGQTVAATVLAHGTGGINVDACRTATDVPRPARVASGNTGAVYGSGLEGGTAAPDTTAGRWPANVLLSHAPLLDEHGEPVGDACADGCVPGCAVADLDEQSGLSASPPVGSVTRTRAQRSGSMENPTSDRVIANGYGDSGGASRFFPTFRYQAKAPKKERPTIDGKGWPTVKPLGLMQWLARLLCPPGGTVLDPFPGTGTTGRAAQIEGFDSVLIERDEFARDLIAVRIPDVVLGAVPEPAEPEPVPVPVEPAPEPESVTTWDLLVSIAAATSGAELRAIHTEHMAVWNEECTAALVARVDELAAQESVA